MPLRFFVTPFLLAAFVSVLKAQEDYIYESTLRIQEARCGNTDRTEMYVSTRAYVYIYSTLDTTTSMELIMPRAKTKSYGQIDDLRFSEEEPTDSTYRSLKTSGLWYYNNTYDEEKGIARFELNQIYRPEGTVFILLIATEDKQLCRYSGYEEYSTNLKD